MEPTSHADFILAVDRLKSASEMEVTPDMLAEIDALTAWIAVLRSKLSQLSISLLSSES